MFRDLKEYQELAKIYAEKVSKTAEVKSDELAENYQENRRKLNATRTELNKGRVEKQFGFLKPKPRNLAPGQTSVRKSGVNATNLNKSKVETKVKTDKPIGGGNAGASTDSGGTAGIQKTETKPVETKPVETKPLTTKQKFDAKFIKKDKGSGFVKRGTPMAQRAEKKEAGVDLKINPNQRKKCLISQ